MVFKARIMTPKCVFNSPGLQVPTKTAQAEALCLQIVFPLHAPMHTDHNFSHALTIADEVILHCTPQPLGFLPAVYASETILHSDLQT